MNLLQTLRQCRAQALRAGFVESTLDVQGIAEHVMAECSHMAFASFFHVFCDSGLSGTGSVIHSYGNKAVDNTVHDYPILIPYTTLQSIDSFVADLSIRTTIARAITDLVNDLDDQTLIALYKQARHMQVPIDQAHNAFIGMNNVMGISICGDTSRSFKASQSSAYERMEKPGGLFSVYRRRMHRQFGENKMLTFSSRSVRCGDPELELDSATVTAIGLHLNMKYRFPRLVTDIDIPIFSNIC